MEAYTQKHKDGTTVTYTGKKLTMCEILAKTENELTHAHVFVFLFANGYKATLPIDCYVEVIDKDTTDTSQITIIRRISAELLKTVFKKQPNTNTDAVWVFDALLDSRCFIYTHEFTDPANLFRFYFVQSKVFRNFIDFNRNNLVCVSIEDYICDRIA